MHIYICITESLCSQQRLTQHCKSTILQSKNVKKKINSRSKCIPKAVTFLEENTEKNISDLILKEKKKR